MKNKICRQRDIEAFQRPKVNIFIQIKNWLAKQLSHLLSSVSSVDQDVGCFFSVQDCVSRSTYGIKVENKKVN